MCGLRTSNAVGQDEQEQGRVACVEEAKRAPYDGTTPASERLVPPHVVVNGEVEVGEGQDRRDGEEGGAADCCDPGPHLR